MLKLATGVLTETAANSSHRSTLVLATELLRWRACCRARSRHLSSDTRSSDDSTRASEEGATSSVANECGSHSETPKNDSAPKEPPVAPGETECCGSGCSNCVWLEYAEDLVEYYKDGGAQAAEAVARIPDPNVRQFVKTELEFLLKSKK
ncbi:hypothetical protein HPB50_017946 [Hyalomma asiaticum]|uniref:Uncharacterized protein n=1 Tax=Hyalomma asiaticum TaxID=266040 RepID=A0ACB7T8A4_HYAAI|nr:hypothetical protein HPB50_017946 [Hyalomma asiaticum]